MNEKLEQEIKRIYPNYQVDVLALWEAIYISDNQHHTIFARDYKGFLYRGPVYSSVPVDLERIKRAFTHRVHVVDVIVPLFQVLPNDWIRVLLTFLK